MPKVKIIDVPKMQGGGEEGVLYPGTPDYFGIYGAINKKGDYPKERQAVIDQLSNLPIYTPDIRYQDYQTVLPYWKRNLETVPIQTGNKTPSGGSSYYGYGAPLLAATKPYEGTIQMDPRQFDQIQTPERVLEHELRHAAFDGSRFIPQWYGDALYTTARNPEEFENGAHHNRLKERASMLLGTRKAIIDRYGLKPNAKIPRNLFDDYNKGILESSIRGGYPSFSDYEETFMGAKNPDEVYNLINFENIRPVTPFYEDAADIVNPKFYPAGKMGGQFEDGGEKGKKKKKSKTAVVKSYVDNKGVTHKDIGLISSVPIFTDDPKKVKNYQDSSYSYNWGNRLLNAYKKYAGDDVIPVNRGSKLDLLIRSKVKPQDLLDNSQEVGIKELDPYFKEYHQKANKSIKPIDYQAFIQDPENSVIDLATGRSFLNMFGVAERKPGAKIPMFPKPVQPYVLSYKQPSLYGTMQNVPSSKRWIKLKGPLLPIEMMEPSLKRKYIKQEPISMSRTFNPGVTSLNMTGVNLPPVQQGNYRVEYFDPSLGEETHRMFMTQDESDAFANELSNRNLSGVPAAGNITQRVEYSKGGQANKFFYNKGYGVPRFDNGGGPCYDAQGNVIECPPTDVMQDDFNKAIDFHTKWLKGRATLPQFTELANQRLALIPKIKMQPASAAELNEGDVGALAYYNSRQDPYSIFVPDPNDPENAERMRIINPNVLGHEINHLFNYHAHQNFIPGTNDFLHLNRFNLPYKGSSFQDYDREHLEGKHAKISFRPPSQQVPIGLAFLNWTNATQPVLVNPPKKKNKSEIKFAPGTEKESMITHLRMAENLDPTEIITEEKAKSLIDKYSKYPFLEKTDNKTPESHTGRLMHIFFEGIKNDPKSLAWLLNNLVKNDENKIGADMVKWGGPTRMNRFGYLVDKKGMGGDISIPTLPDTKGPLLQFYYDKL